jgi:zinc-ribbon family
MLIIGFGVTEVLLSTLVFTSEACGNHAAHQLTKQHRKFSLFFIPLFSVGTKYLDSYTACGRIIEVSKEQAAAAARQVGPDRRRFG